MMDGNQFMTNNILMSRFLWQETGKMNWYFRFGSVDNAQAWLSQLMFCLHNEMGFPSLAVFPNLKFGMVVLTSFHCVYRGLLILKCHYGIQSSEFWIVYGIICNILGHDWFITLYENKIHRFAMVGSGCLYVVIEKQIVVFMWIIDMIGSRETLCSNRDPTWWF